MEIFSSQFLAGLVAIIIVDLVLAGDNAVVIALASQKLPLELRKKAIYFGTLGAVLIRVVMTLVATYLLQIPFLEAIGGLILIPIAFKLLKPKHEESHSQDHVVPMSFAAAIRTIIIADAAMGIDNVLAIAGVAHGDMLLVLIGLAISIPIVVKGSQIIASLMDRLPILIIVGAGILGYTAGKMIIHDDIVGGYLLGISSYFEIIVPVLLVIMIIIYGLQMQNKAKRH